MSRTALYHMYQGDTLLYVGMSLHPRTRYLEHKSRKAWLEDVSRVEIQWFKTRQEAAFAEKIAIQDGDPVHNIMKYCRTEGVLPRQKAQSERYSAVADVIREIGKERIKADMNVKDRAISEHIFRGVLPAMWFAYCEDAVGRELPRDMFSFKQDLMGEFV